MEEKVLIKSEKYNVKKTYKTMVIIGAILSIIIFLITISVYMEPYDRLYQTYLEHREDGRCDWYSESWEKCYICQGMSKSANKFEYALIETFEEAPYFFIPIAALGLIGGLITLWLRSYELTVTNKRIYGKVAWGKRVDLPVDSVSATSTIRLFKGVSVSTASGRISFRAIKNANEIYNVVNNLLIERQQEKAKPEVVQTIQATDEADQIKKYKDLLDSGVITQEEFDAKKKQLLGL